MIRPNHVGTLDVERTTIPFTPPSRRLHPGTPARHEAVAVVAALSTVFTAFLLPGVALYWRATLSAIGLVGEVLDTGERSRVDARLELALDEHRVADVEDEAGADEQRNHGKGSDDQDLAALVRRPTAKSRVGPRLAAVETGVTHLRTERHLRGKAIPRFGDGRGITPFGGVHLTG